MAQIVRRAALSGLPALARQYATVGTGDVKRIRTHSGLRLRVGDWRVFFTRRDEGVIEIDTILHRREAYRRP
ncbi:MAG: type II toxin-antitoxin system RelE/ParE family toxin [Acidobacteria bacterium]|nr:type II toxin-antitoxin system RelE/ParE family toxin [Acidobacteriota bacterium]